MQSNRTISIIIPSLRIARKKTVDSLRSSLQSGTLKPDEMVIVENTSPAGRARNIGASRSKGDILVFCDDDAIIADPELLEKVVSILLTDDSIGLVGTAIGIPKDSNRFQREYGRQFPRSSTDVASKIEDRFMITPLFCAVRKSDFEKVDGFSEILTGGEDRYFCHTIRKIGKRVVIAPNTIVYHPLPKNMQELIHREIWYGSAKALISNVPDYPTGKAILCSKPMALLYLVAHTFVFPFRFFIGGPGGKSIGFWPLRAIGHYIHSIAYALAVLKKR